MRFMTVSKAMISKHNFRAVDELIRVISNSNIAISVDEIEALVGDSPENNIEPEPSKHPGNYEAGIKQHTTFSYPPLDPVSFHQSFLRTLSLIFRLKFNFLIQMIRK